MRRLLLTLISLLTFVSSALAGPSTLRVMEIDYATAPTNLQIPYYNGTTLRWVPGPLSTVLDDDLDAIAALSGTSGLLCKTAANTWALRTMQAPAAGLTITNPAGVAGDPTFALANDLSALEGMSGTGLVSRTGSEAYAQRTLTAPAAGITVSDGDGVSGNPTLALANDLSALEAMSGTGLVARTGSETYAQRIITGTSNQITVTNGDGIAGNPVLSTPQDIATTSSPTFNSLTLTGSTPVISLTGPDPVIGLDADTEQLTILGGSSSAASLVLAGASAPVGFATLQAADDSSADVNISAPNSTGAINVKQGGSDKVVIDSTGITASTDVIFTSSPTTTIRTNTSDGADTNQIAIRGGGGSGNERGSFIRFFGNEASGAEGFLDLSAGNTTSSNSIVNIRAPGSNGSFNVINQGTTRLSIGNSSSSWTGPESASWTPTLSASSGTYTSTSLSYARYFKFGRFVYVAIVFSGTTSTNTQYLQATLPFASAALGNGQNAGCSVGDGGGALGGYVTISSGSSTAQFTRYDAAVFTAGAGRFVLCNFFYISAT